MLRRQRDMAEEDRDGWKLRAMKAEQDRQIIRKNMHELIVNVDVAMAHREAALRAECKAMEQRAEAAEARRREIDDEAFAYAEQIEVLRTECDALRQDAARLDFLADEPVFEGFADSPLDVYELESIVAEQNGRSEPTQADRREAFRRVIDAALAVQP
jgi:hypothetical protein